MRSLLPVVLAGSLAICAFSSAEAASHSFCDKYARQAVAQYKMSVIAKCGFAGNRWHRNYSKHYRWCRHAELRAAALEQKKRSQAYEACLAKRGNGGCNPLPHGARRLATLKDNCSRKYVRVGGTSVADRQCSGLISLRSGHAALNVTGGFRWFCSSGTGGGTAERSNCPSGTTHVRVNRNHGGRRFTTDCLRWVTCRKEMRVLDTLKDNCSRHFVRVGGVSVRDRGKSGRISIRKAALNNSGGFRWYCADRRSGGTAERSNCPAGTSHLVIDRNHSGRRFTTQCIGKKNVCRPRN